MTVPEPEQRRRKEKEREETRGAFKRVARKRLRPRPIILQLDRDAWGPADAHLWVTPSNNDDSWDHPGYDAGNTRIGPANSYASPDL